MLKSNVFRKRVAWEPTKKPIKKENRIKIEIKINIRMVPTLVCNIPNKWEKKNRISH